MQEGLPVQALSYILGNLLLGYLAVVLGQYLVVMLGGKL